MNNLEKNISCYNNKVEFTFKNNVSSYIKDNDEENLIDTAKVSEFSYNNVVGTINANFMFNENPNTKRSKNSLEKINENKISPTNAENILDENQEKINNNSKDIEIKENIFLKRKNSLEKNVDGNVQENNNFNMKNFSYNKRYDYYTDNVNQLNTARENRLTHPDLEIFTSNKIKNNKLLYSLNEEDFKNIKNNEIENIIFNKNKLNDLNTSVRDEFCENLNEKIIIKDSIKFSETEINKNKGVYEKIKLEKKNTNEKIDKKNNELLIKDSIISLDNLNNPIKQENLNINNNDISEISKISENNLNSHQNSVIYNFGKKDNTYDNTKITEIFLNNISSNDFQNTKLNSNSKNESFKIQNFQNHSKAKSNNLKFPTEKDGNKEIQIFESLTQKIENKAKENNEILENKFLAITSRKKEEINDNDSNLINQENQIIATEESGIEDEFKKNEMSENECASHISSSIDNKSVISSNILSHINHPKMLGGLRGDMSFTSVNTKSENSRFETMNNYLYTENEHMNNPFNMNPNKQIIGEDQEFEMSNENYDGFKFIETPKSSKLTGINSIISNAVYLNNNQKNINYNQNFYNINEKINANNQVFFLLKF